MSMCSPKSSSMKPSFKSPVTPKSKCKPSASSPLAVYYQSPVARRLQVLPSTSAAGNMCKGLPTGAAKASPKYTSPSIKNWLAKRSPKASPSPRKSPRKLIISPIKSPLSSAGTLTVPGKGVKRKLDCEHDEDPAKRTKINHQEHHDRLFLTPRRGMKRKLDEGDVDCDNNNVSKRRGASSGNDSPAQEADTHRVFNVVNGNTEAKELTPQPKKSARKPLFITKDDSENATPLDEDYHVTPVKIAAVSLPFQDYSSPTSNLPNSVHDPLPRNTLLNTDSDKESPKAKRCIDWLTKIRLDKNSPVREGENNVAVTNSPCQPCPAVHKCDTPSPSTRKRRFRSMDPSQDSPRRSLRGHSRPSSPATIQVTRTCCSLSFILYLCLS